MRYRHSLLWIFLTFVSYLLTAKIGLEYAVIQKTVTLLWPPSGIALSAILIHGYKVWPGVALGALAANTDSALPILTLIIITIGDTLEPLLGALCLRASTHFAPTLHKVSDVMKLVVYAAFGSTVIGATMGSGGLLIGGEIDLTDYWITWLTWWLGDGMGVLVISPVILCMPSIDKSFLQEKNLPRFFELLILVALLLIIGNNVFENKDLAKLGNFPTSLSLFPILLWAALRFGSLGAASVVLMASSLAIHGTVNGLGPFAVESKTYSLILWCIFADLMAITGLLLAAVDSGRKTALAALKKSNEYLDAQVRERSSELLDANIALNMALSERRRLQFEMSQLSEDRQKMIGQELHDGLGQQLTGINFLLYSLQQTLAAKSAPEALTLATVNDLLSQAITTLRALSHGFYPTALETGGLSQALHQLAEHSQSFFGVRCVSRCVINGLEIDKTIAINLYRIAQEAVNNALRHSAAKEIEINLTLQNDQYRLSIDDNGAGISQKNMSLLNTLGLRSMQNRANLVEAILEIKNKDDGGTSIAICGPLKLTETSIIERTKYKPS